MKYAQPKPSPKPYEVTMVMGLFAKYCEVYGVKLAGVKILSGSESTSVQKTMQTSTQPKWNGDDRILRRKAAAAVEPLRR